MSLFSIEDYERVFIDRLQAASVSYEESYICILMYFKTISRPSNELPGILSRYSTKLTEANIRDAFENLIKQGLFKRDYYARFEVYKLVDNYEDKLEEYTGIENLAQELHIKKEYAIQMGHQKSKVDLNPLNIVSAEGNYFTLLIRLQSASSTIKAAMLASPVYESTAAVLEEMAESGVRVQLLIGSEKVVKRIKGESAEVTYKKWKKRFAGNKNIQVKKFSDYSVAELCSSYLIDDAIIRLVVYDYESTRSLEGYLLEVVQHGNSKINLVNWYKNRFDEAWADVGREKTIRIAKLILSLAVSASLVCAILRFKWMGLAYDCALMLLGFFLSYIVRSLWSYMYKFIKKLSAAMKEIRR